MQNYMSKFLAVICLLAFYFIGDLAAQTDVTVRMLTPDYSYSIANSRIARGTYDPATATATSEEAPLTEAHFATLKAKFQESGFLDMPENNGEGENRYLIYVQFQNESGEQVRKQVFYMADADFVPPAAFQEVYSYLMELDALID
ncbi:MAG: hypothetical protein JJT94_09145 [Bernardetiaceae bacterium]|nr:hypothetical protein [Bernardetiaceae bacterium]